VKEIRVMETMNTKKEIIPKGIKKPGESNLVAQCLFPVQAFASKQKSFREITAALPAAWVNCVILGSLTLPADLPFLMPIKTGHGSYSGICFMTPLSFAGKRLRANINSGLETNCCLWTAPPYHYA